MKYLIVGLGNIGEQYHQTRHNIGFMILEALAQSFQATFSLNKLAYTSEVRYKGCILWLIKPTTYMNLSGKAVNYWLKQQEIPLENLLVVVDDVHLPFGKMRLRAGGSSAGHNGLKDIEAKLGTQQYPRLRFGIGNDYPKGRQVEYVLSKFTPEQLNEMPSLLQKAQEIILSFCTVGIVQTMNLYN
ncbi:MAG: aminoacyl-tRNA hydrolase [Cytophagales bacterium]|nr:aminoacyl-tRNA hydrolase [Bernardetiaceae bacterium]MDW8211150.1 aminoacyl-tRNA hydrolase [Cytophagales bacterium]